MKRFIFLLVLVLQSFFLFAQDIQVFSKFDKKPISNVLIFNKDTSKSIVTNEKGEADIAIFSKTEVIFFSHIIYKSQKTDKQELKDKNYKIYLAEKLTYLDEIVFSADKSNTKKSDLPMRLETLSVQQIQLQNPQTSTDLLAKSGAVFVQKSQAGGGSPVLRGFEANRVLLVIDGIRMNNAIYRSGHLPKYYHN